MLHPNYYIGNHSFLHTRLHVENCTIIASMQLYNNIIVFAKSLANSYDNLRFSELNFRYINCLSYFHFYSSDQWFSHM